MFPFNKKEVQKKVGLILAIVGVLLLINPEPIFGIDTTHPGLGIAIIGLIYFIEVYI